MQMALYFEQKMKLRRLSYEFCGCYMFIFTLLEVVGKTHMSVHDNNHAFIQANSNDVRFMGVHDGLQVFMHKDVASSGVRISNIHEDLDDEDAFSTSTYLKFVPPQLDFKERHLGIPHLEKVMLVNTDNNKTIHMSSVSGNTLHFHSSFFQDKTIPPKGNTTFAVVFLGRAEGQVSSSLYIHTSEGTFKYQVSGASVGSPYRLRPLGGVRLPLNAAFQPIIHLHNPHHYPIQVVEVYSSGSEFHLELPGGEMEGPKALWEVPPFTTKPVIRARFQANTQSNHTAYIRMKLNNSDEVLVVPLEVEVSSQPGLYSPQHIIDFGLGGSQDQPIKVKVYLCNSLKKALRIQSVVASPSSNALKIDFEPMKIPPGTTPVEVAEITFNWKIAFETKQTSGKIWIKSKQSQYKLVIPFTATVLEGGLEVDESVTRFLTTEDKLFPRHFMVVNHFKIPVAVNNVSLLQEAFNHFKIKKFAPLIVPPGMAASLFILSAKESSLKDIRVESGIVLATNISDVTVPLLSYNGKLTQIFPPGFEDLELLDVGLVSSGSVKTIRFGLQNNNPVSVELKSIGSNLHAISPQLLGVFYGNVSSFLGQYGFANLTNSTTIEPNGIAVVELTIHASKTEEVMSGQIVVLGQYEKLTIPVRVSVAHGALEMIPHQIILDDCFPGKVCSQALKVQSTFNRPMTATSVTSVPPDPRLSFSGGPGGSEILPSSSNYIGELRWEPGKYCGHHCYLGVSSNSSNSGVQWTQSETLPPYTCDTDATIFRDRFHRLLNLTNGVGSGHWQDIVLRLDTNEVREQLFKAKVKLIWPKFSNTSKLKFPLTQVTNTTVQRLKLYNPASHMIVVQLVMEWAYPQPKRLLDSFPPSFRPTCGGDCFTSSPKEFFISQDFPESSEPHGKLNTTLAPGESYEVTIAYTPRSPQKSVGLLLIRNNLTVMEVIELHGQAAHAQLKFGNRKPGSDNPLTFEIAEKHLRDCNSKSSGEKNKKFLSPNLTVKRSFTARNIGDLPIFVHNFYISGLECEGYGFSVLNCGPFELPANGTRKIDIAFTPDFTLSKVQRTLTIETSLGVEVNYSLITTLPPFFLSACSSVLGRPTWEPLLYYSAVSFMVFLLFCVLAAAFFESDRILKCALMTMARDRATVPLDLRQIGTGVLKEFSNNSNAYRKLETESEHNEKNKSKEVNVSNTPGWVTGSSADDRQYANTQKDEKFEFHNKSEESVDYVKDKDALMSTNSPVVQLNNFTKSKKKLGKKNSNSSDTTTEIPHETFSNKKKEKNVANSGWCSVFTRGNSNCNDKIKLKLTANENDNIKQIRNDIESKKDEIKKDEKSQNKTKKNVNKEPSKEEEETSSTMTDSSNDAEKENSDSLSRGKNEKLRKLSNKKAKSNVTEVKDNYEGDCDDDDFEKEKKNSQAKGMWKVNSKTNKFNNFSESNINVWKSSMSENDPQKNVDAKQRINKNMRDRKEKNTNKRKFCEKTGNQRVMESSIVQHTAPCWEHRSFSEVVARTDNPLLYSNIVSSKTHQQKQQLQSSSVYPDPSKPCESSVSSVLGPIGSKKPASNWSPIPYNTNATGNLFNLGFGDTTPGFMEGNPSTSDFNVDGSMTLEDTLPLDAEDRWEAQHAAMQIMHENTYQLSWSKAENWPTDYFWNRNNVQQTNTTLSTQNDYPEQTWGSFLRSSWSPTTWSPSTNQSHRSSLDNGIAVGQLRNSYSPLSEGDSLISHGLHTSNLAIGSIGQGSSISPGSGISQGSGIGQGSGISQGHFAQNPMTQLPRPQTADSSVTNVLQFDPFHSLSSIWSPKAPNSWTSPGNQ